MNREGKWEDSTSYSQSVPLDKRKPSSWTIYLSVRTRVVINSTPRYPDEPWNCAVYGPISISTFLLEAENLERAKIEALVMTNKIAEALASAAAGALVKGVNEGKP